MSFVLAPDRPPRCITCWRIEAKVDIHYMDEEPGSNSEKLISKKGALGVRFAFGERIIYSTAVVSDIDVRLRIASKGTYKPPW